VYKEIWDLVDDLVDQRCEYDENKYGKEIEDIKDSIEELASKIESDKKEERND